MIEKVPPEIEYQYRWPSLLRHNLGYRIHVLSSSFNQHQSQIKGQHFTILLMIHGKLMSPGAILHREIAGKGEHILFQEKLYTFDFFTSDNNMR